MKHIVLAIAALLFSHISMAQDTILVASLDTIEVKAKHKWDNEHERYQFNQMRYYITIILPYVNEATQILNELSAIEKDPSINKKARKRIIKQKEQEVRNKFEDEILALNETQGTYLVKLIARQSGKNIYQTLKDYKGLPTALKWLSWAKVHGFNLNKKYNPKDEPIMERVMESLGYPLPIHYSNQNRYLDN